MTRLVLPALEPATDTRLDEIEATWAAMAFTPVIQTLGKTIDPAADIAWLCAQLRATLGVCQSCGGTRWPVVHGRCSLCVAAFGPSSPPEHIATILPRVLAALTSNGTPMPNTYSIALPSGKAATLILPDIVSHADLGAVTLWVARYSAAAANPMRAAAEAR